MISTGYFAPHSVASVRCGRAQGEVPGFETQFVQDVAEHVMRDPEAHNVHHIRLHVEDAEARDREQWLEHGSAIRPPPVRDLPHPPWVIRG